MNTPGFSSTKNVLLFIFLLKLLKTTKVLLQLHWFHLRINFFPKAKTLIIAKFGLRLLDNLWMFTGITWFSKMKSGAISIPLTSISPLKVDNLFHWLDLNQYHKHLSNIKQGSEPWIYGFWSFWNWSPIGNCWLWGCQQSVFT